MVPYIHIYQKTLDIYFWTDLAGGSPLLELLKDVKFLNDQNINFVPKSENPPNTPEICCIENIWGLTKEEVFKDGWDWEVENLDQLRTRILSCFKKVYQESVQNFTNCQSRGTFWLCTFCTFFHY